MGAFYTNVSVRADRAAVAAAWDDGPAFAADSPPWTVLVAAAWDDDVDRAEQAAARLIRGLDTVALLATVHDSDILLLTAFMAGESSGTYDSAPDYFEDTVGRGDPTGASGAELVGVLGLAVDPAAVDAVLLSEDDVAYLFAEDRHAAVLEALGLPLEASVSASAAYVLQESEHYPQFTPLVVGP